MQITLQAHWQFHLWRVSLLAAWIPGLDFQTMEAINKEASQAAERQVRHLYFAEKVWYHRLHGEGTAFSMDETIPLPELCSFWKVVTSKWAEEAETAHTKKMAYKNLSGEPFTNLVSEVMMHLVDHATYHTGQLMSQVRQAGVTPIHTGYIHYRRLVGL